jgi:hypothetical protein
MAHPRTRNPRRLVVQDLRSLKRILENTISLWVFSASERMVDDSAARQSGQNVTYRRRRPEEYPESTVESWDRLIDLGRQITHFGDVVVRYATQQKDTLQAPDHRLSCGCSWQLVRDVSQAGHRSGCRFAVDTTLEEDIA